MVLEGKSSLSGWYLPGPRFKSQILSLCRNYAMFGTEHCPFHLTSSISNPMISDATSCCKSPDSTNWIQQEYTLDLLRAPSSSEQGEPWCFKQVYRTKEEGTKIKDI